MLLAMFFLTMPLNAEAEWTMNDLEIYTSLRKDMVAVNEYGETFVLDPSECQIIKLNPDGSFALRFGKKGQGPGEFNRPGNLQVFGDHVYIDDFMTSSVICYDRKGVYVNQWKVSSARDRTRVADGWLYGTWKYNPMNDPSLGKFLQVDLEFKQEKVLHDFGGKDKKEENSPYGIQLEMKDGYVIMPHNPAPDMPRLGVSGDGKFAALVQPGTQLKVDIYDSATGKVVAIVHQKSQPMAFNKDWGEKHIEAMNKVEEASSQKFKMKVTPRFPDFFPYVKSFWAHADGRFYLLPWSKNPNEPGKIICFDEKGTFQDHELTPEIAERLLYLNETHGWVGTFDAEEEQAGVAKVPRKDLADFIKAHPINEDASANTVMVIGG